MTSNDQARDSLHDDQDDLEPIDPNVPQRVVPTTELFAGQREIWIEHQGVRYRLRITRRNKLILQK